MRSCVTPALISEVDSGGSEQDFFYDDHFIFVLNDYALWGSYEDHRSMLTQADGAYIYAWNDIRDENMGFDTEPWIAGQNQNSYLTVPIAEGSADMTVGLQNSILDGIIDQSTTEIEARLITFGDNDNGDCESSDISFEATLSIGTQ